MIKHKVIVRDRKITVDNPKIVQYTSKSDQIVLDLDSDWDSVTPVIVLGSGSKAQVAYYDDETLFPEDLTEKVGPVPLSIVGIGDDAKVKIVTMASPMAFRIVPSGDIPRKLK